MTTQHALRFLIKCSLLTTLVFLASCESILDVQQPNQLASETVYANADRIRQILNGVYDAFGNGNFAGGRLHVYGEIRGADIENRTENNVTARNTYDHQFNPVSQEVLGCWSTGYSVVNRANDIIEGIAANPSRLSAAQASAWTAEARFLRGLSFLYMVNLYARPFHSDPNSPGIPLRLRFESSSANNNLARATVAATYTQIQTDLEFALANLPSTYGTANERVVRVHQNTARAALMRMHLYKQEYAQAQARADEMISDTFPVYRAPSGVPNTLSPNPADAFSAPWEVTENIFAVPFAAPNDLPGGQNSLSSYYAGTAIIGDYFINTRPGSIWADNTAVPVTNPGAWLATDRRRSPVAMGGWTLAQTFGLATVWIHKWRLNPATDFVHIFRYPEVLLTAAETRCRLNPGATLSSGAGQLALRYYNAVRRRANANTNLTAADFGDNTNNLLVGIMQQRRIEFLGEGHIYYDLRRTGQDLPAKTYSAASLPSVPFSAANYIWPLPQQEINTNRSATQNPGF